MSTINQQATAITSMLGNSQKSNIKIPGQTKESKDTNIAVKGSSQSKTFNFQSVNAKLASLNDNGASAFTTGTNNMKASRPKQELQLLNQKSVQDGTQKKSPIRFRPVSPPSQIKLNKNTNSNSPNTSQSPGRIIPLKQIKIVHSPQPSGQYGSGNSPLTGSTNISPLNTNKTKAQSPQLSSLGPHKPQMGCQQNLNFGFQVSSFEQQQPSSNSNHQQMREKAKQRRKSGNHSRKTSLIGAPDEHQVLPIVSNFLDQEDECLVVDDEFDNGSQPAIPQQTQNIKQLSQLDQESQMLKSFQSKQEERIEDEEAPPTLESQLRQSLTDFCENFSNSRRVSRNSKSRNNESKTTNQQQTSTQSNLQQVFQASRTLEEKNENQKQQMMQPKLEQKVPLGGNVQQQEGKSYFLNKVKNNQTTVTSSLTGGNFNTISTSLTNLNQQTYKSDLENSNSLQQFETVREIGSNGATFDKEMQKHGLANDLKKLDSFNQFIEKHSPKNSRLNSCSYFGDDCNNILDGGQDSFRSPNINQAKFKRAGSGGDLLNLQNLQSQNSIDNTNTVQQQQSFQFPFQRRARSISPPKNLQANEVIQQKLESMSPRGNHNGSIIDAYQSIDGSQQQINQTTFNSGKRNGPIKAQQPQSNFLFGSQINNNWDYSQNDSSMIQQQANPTTAMQKILQSPKYQQLAEAVQMYLNGDYTKIIKNDVSTEEIDLSCDPEQMMRHSQDVDEWLLSGLSESHIQKSSTYKRLMEEQENEDNMILRKLEENQIKQASEAVEKTVIIDDFDEELIQISQDSRQMQDEKTYLNDRRVTTVVEQQTWEDMEDDYDGDNNESNIIAQFNQMQNNSSSESVILHSYKNSPEEFADENLIDENEELQSTSAVVSFDTIQQLTSVRSVQTAQIDLFSPSTQQNESGEDWMFKTFTKQNQNIMCSSSQQNLGMSQTQNLNSLLHNMPPLSNNSRNMKNNITQQNSANTVMNKPQVQKAEPPKEFLFNEKKKGFNQRQKEDINQRISMAKKQSSNNINKGKSPREVKIDLVVLQQETQQVKKPGMKNNASNIDRNQANKSKLSNKSNKENKGSKQQMVQNEQVQQPKTSLPNKFIKSRPGTSLQQNNAGATDVKKASVQSATNYINKKEIPSSRQSLEKQQEPEFKETQSHPHHRRNASGSGHRHRRTQSKAFDPQFLEQINSSQFIE